jgi:iron complex outermembrane recepter protein
VTVPNPNLGPESADNLLARLAYYFEPVGTLAVTVRDNRIKNLAQRFDFPASAFGYGEDPIYSTYDFISKQNIGGSKEFKGLELEYRQQLQFLPGALKGLGVFANYTRNYATIRSAGLVPHTISGGLNYRFRGLTTAVNAKWTDVSPYSGTVGRFRKQRTMVDFNANFRVWKNIGVFVQARNILDVPDYIFDVDQARINKIEYYGAIWTFGVKGTY